MTTHSLYINPHTTVEEAKLLFEAHTLSLLPVCDGTTFMGVLDKIFIEHEPNESLVSDYQYAFYPFFVLNTATWDEVMEAFSAYQTNMLPVLTASQQFVGYYLLSDFIQQLAQTPFMQEAGRILILEKSLHDYSFTEISRIVEEHRGRLLALYVSNYTSSTVHVTLKLIAEPLSEILQSFRRYGYGILSEKEDDDYRQELKDISHYFERYINM